MEVFGKKRQMEINLDINKRLGSVLNSGVRQETDSIMMSVLFKKKN